MSTIISFKLTYQIFGRYFFLSSVVTPSIMDRQKVPLSKKPSEKLIKRYNYTK